MILLDSVRTTSKIVYRFAWMSPEEESFSSVVNSLLQVHSFVVKLTTSEIHFNLSGKYLVLPISDFHSFHDVYAKEDTSILDDGTLDHSSVTTIVITEQPVSGSLHILEKVDRQWCVPLHSQIRISKTAAIVIDDGEL